MKTFLEFVDKKVRESKRHLSLVKKLFEKVGMPCTAHLDEDTPYIFLKNPHGQLSFEGVRVYKIGDTMAYRVQKQETTHPYGKAYMLDLEEMYDDFMSEDIAEQKAAEMIIKTVSEELKKFFVKSSEAEGELRNQEFGGPGQDGLGKIILRSTGTDYSQLINSKM